MGAATWVGGNAVGYGRLPVEGNSFVGLSAVVVFAALWAMAWVLPLQ